MSIRAERANRSRAGLPNTVDEPKKKRPSLRKVAA